MTLFFTVLFISLLIGTALFGQYMGRLNQKHMERAGRDPANLARLKVDGAPEFDQARLEKMNPNQRGLLEAAGARLKQANIDVEGILKRHKEMTEQRRLDGEKVVAELDGQRLRLAGYLLPLETSDRKVTEFLLVPWVGACIHTPPPPPNQIVHVNYPEGIEASVVFAPVWIEGTMTTVRSTANLFLRDGSADIPTGYSLHASLVEPYVEQ